MEVNFSGANDINKPPLIIGGRMQNKTTKIGRGYGLCFSLTALCRSPYLLFLIIKVSMAIALVVLVGYLLTELLAHTFVVLATLKSAGTVAALGFEAFLDRFDDLFIGI